MQPVLRRFCAVALATVMLATGAPTAGAALSGGAAGRPDRIVSLSPTATEMLFAIGAGRQVVAVDDRSTYPSRAPMTDLSGYQPNTEAIAGYRPDLVVIDPFASATGDALTGLGIDVEEVPAAEQLSDTYAQIRRLGQVTGHAGRARRLVASMRRAISKLVARVPDRDEAPMVYYELDDTLYSADSTTFIGRLLERAGLENIADDAGGGSAYPQLSAEYIVDADPAVIFLADAKCCGETPETVAARPGFGEVAAVRDGNVVALDDDVASRWGPRVVDLLRRIVRTTSKL